MAHVKCDYQEFYCNPGLATATCDCLTCGAEYCINFGDCVCLQLRPAYIEKTSKSIRFDGETLFIGGKYIASFSSDDKTKHMTGDTYINNLEIDGKVFIKDCEIVNER